MLFLGSRSTYAHRRGTRGTEFGDGYTGLRTISDSNSRLQESALLKSGVRGTDQYSQTRAATVSASLVLKPHFLY